MIASINPYFDFDALLHESAKTHGHLCPGQVLGVRMSILGLKKIGIFDPKGKDKKSLIVFVEIDRCATDAIQSVTGCTLGHRTLKFLDYGKMAATFLNIKENKAVRVIAKEEAKIRAKEYFPDYADKYKAQLEAYKIMLDEELFDIMDVTVNLKQEDLPGKPLSRVKCSLCGEYVQDSREIKVIDEILCKPCAKGGYYSSSNSNAIFLKKPVMQKCHNELEIRSKIWIEKHGEVIFGRGRKQLFKAIDKYGSINQAAKELDISYRKAWSYINAMEERLGIKLVERFTGGKSGGGAKLTDECREFLTKYERLEEGINENINKKFYSIFY